MVVGIVGLDFRDGWPGYFGRAEVIRAAPRLAVGSCGSDLALREQCVNRTTGWQKGRRLPSVHELGSLIDSTKSNPALPTGHPFTNIATGPKGYWSARRFG